MAKSGEQFIHSKDTDLHHSTEVESVVGYLRQNGEKIANAPEAKITAYIGFLASKEAVNDGILTGDKDSIARQIEHLVIEPSDVPESYFDLQRRIAREQGHGDIEITSDMRRQMAEALQADQQKSLEKWAEYINGPDGTYPAWFEYYAWQSLQKLGQFDKEKSEFTKRTKSTVAPYPELNREALAYVYDKLAKSLDSDIADEPEKLQKLLQGGNFGKLYAHALLEATSTKEIIKNIEGSWKKYDQTDDTRTARRLSESLAGYGTGWCTAGQETAAMQLQGGDFYVYYTKDEDGKDTTPRVAIRMANGQVAEVRGILAAQELEPDFYDILKAKLAELPGGAEYTLNAEDMKRLTALDNILQKDPNAVLSVDDLRFLYEFDHKIEGFGYNIDPRINEILVNRDFIVDFSEIYNTQDHNIIAKGLIDAKRGYYAADLLDKFTGFDQEVAKSLITAGSGSSVANNLDKFTGLDHQEVAKSLIDSGYGPSVAANLDKFTGLDHQEIAKSIIDSGDYSSVANNLDKFTGLDHQEVAKSLIDAKLGYSVANNLDKFTGLDHQEVAKSLIDSGYGPSVAANLDKFTGLDHQEVAKSLFDAKLGYYVAANLDKFTGLDHQEIAKSLIDANEGYYVAEYLDKFTGLDHQEIAKSLIDSGDGPSVAANLDKFHLTADQKHQLGL